MNPTALAPAATRSLGGTASTFINEPEKSFPWRLQHLGLILFVSLSMPIASSVYYMLGGQAPTGSMQQKFRLVGALITEATSLALLWYVMSRQGRSWRAIGWKPGVLDIPKGLGLFVAGNVLMYALMIPVQYAYRAYAGHFLLPKPLNSILGFGISALSIAFVCLNPFFEELIVRAYTISEIINLGGSRTVAVILSVVVQMSYHLYQGLASAVALTLIFTIFSIYYVRTQRIVPVILAHLCADLFALIHGVL